jgi:hypothetical protein
MHDNKSTIANKCTYYAGRFDVLGNPLLQYRAHCPMKDIRGHWMPPPGDYLHRITRAAARVIGFGTHNKGCDGDNSTFEDSSKKA